MAAPLGNPPFGPPEEPQESLLDPRGPYRVNLEVPKPHRMRNGERARILHSMSVFEGLWFQLAFLRGVREPVEPFCGPLGSDLAGMSQAGLNALRL
eukprot:9233780-Pyramimonas_sp.AAC.1